MTMDIAVALDPGDACCLIFDWDGTLVDTRRANYLALSETFADLGVGLDEHWYNQRTGLSTDSMIEAWLAECGLCSDVPVADLAKRRDEIFLRTAYTIRPVGPVLEVAQRYAGQLAMAVASGGSRGVIEPTMRKIGLNGLFDVLITREDVARGKPDPQIFLLAAERLAILPALCLVYEDSDEGVRAAHAAGMPVVDVRPLLSERA